MREPISERELEPTLKMRRVTPAQPHVQPLPLRIAHGARKVPEVTLLFWVVKLLTTGMGETTSDYLVFHMNSYIAVALGAIGLAAAMLLQLSAKRYFAWIYWFAVVMVAIFGTMAADVVHIVLGVPYLISSIFFAAALAVIFGVWYASEKTLSIHSIYTLRRELFYWSAIMATFALGTAVGDMTASTLRLGYFASGLLFALLFALPALGYWLFKLNPIFAFWFAYIMTRPLGASFADWFGKPRSVSGMGLGTGEISIILAALIVGFVGYLSFTRIDVAPDSEGASRH